MPSRDFVGVPYESSELNGGIVPTEVKQNDGFFTEKDVDVFGDPSEDSGNTVTSEGEIEGPGITREEDQAIEKPFPEPEVKPVE